MQEIDYLLKTAIMLAIFLVPAALILYVLRPPLGFAFFHLVGRCLYWRRKFREAIAFFLAAKKVYPESAGNLLYLGKALYQFGYKLSAEETFKQAAIKEAWPKKNRAEAYYYLCLILYQRLEYIGAIEAFECAIEFEPSYEKLLSEVNRHCHQGIMAC